MAAPDVSSSFLIAAKAFWRERLNRHLCASLQASESQLEPPVGAPQWHFNHKLFGCNVEPNVGTAR